MPRRKKIPSASASDEPDEPGVGNNLEMNIDNEEEKKETAREEEKNRNDYEVGEKATEGQKEEPQTPQIPMQVMPADQQVQPNYETMAKETLYGLSTVTDKIASRTAAPLEGPFKEITDKAVQYLTEVEKMRNQARVMAEQLDAFTSILSGKGPTTPQLPKQETPQPTQQVQPVMPQPIQQVQPSIFSATPSDMEKLVDAFSNLLKTEDVFRKTIIMRLRELGIDAKDVYIPRDEVEKMLQKCREDTLREATDDVRLKQTTELIKHSIDRVTELFAPLITSSSKEVLGYAVDNTKSIQEFLKNPNTQAVQQVQQPVQPVQPAQQPVPERKGILLVAKEEEAEGGKGGNG